MRLRLLGTTLTVGCMCWGSLAVAADEKDWWLEFEAMPGYANNYFFRGEGANAPDTNLFSLYALGEREWKKGKGKFTFDFDAGLVWVLDIDNADYYDLNLGGAYKRSTRKYTADFKARPNQVFEEEGAPIFFDLTALVLGQRIVVERTAQVGLGPAWAIVFGLVLFVGASRRLFHDDIG